MKQFRSIYILAGAAWLLSSCVKDADPVFKDSATARMNNALNAQKEVLVSQPNYWHMEYFPESSQSYGGYHVFLKFTEQEVTAWGEVAESLDKSYTSLYTLTSDDGPVLTFDVFNYVLHYFAAPSGTNANIYGQTGLYQGHQGDFEFILLKVAPDEVIMKGKRSGNILYLHPFDGDPVAYLKKNKETMDTNFRAVVQGTEIMVSTFFGPLGGDNYQYEVDRDMRQLHITKEGEYDGVSRGFIFTPEGLHLYEPFSAGGSSFDDIVWDSAQGCAMIDGQPQTNVLPKGWMGYDSYLGSYVLTYNDNEDWLVSPKTATVTLEKKVAGETYTMTGVNDNYTVTVRYDISGGNIVIMGQIVGKFGDNNVYFAPMAASRAASGNATWTGWRSTSYGIKTQMDVDYEEGGDGKFRLVFISGPSAAGRPINSFGLLMQKPDGSSGGWMSSAALYKDWFIFDDAYYAIFWKDMIKQ